MEAKEGEIVLKVKGILYAFLAAMLVVLSFSQMPALAKEWQYKTTEDVNKVWKVRFNGKMDTSSFTDSNIYVMDGKSIHPTKLSASENGYAVEVKPAKPYEIGKQYRLIIKGSVKSTKGIALKTPIEVPFEVEDPTLKSKSIQSNTNSSFTTVTVRTSSDIYKVTVAGAEMIYNGNNTYSSTMIDQKAGSTVTINFYDENNKLVETKKHTIGSSTNK